MKKITVIGAGDVGSHIVSACMYKNLNVEIILTDKNKKLQDAQVRDLKDTSSFYRNTKVKAINLSDKYVQDSDIFVITAGARQEEGEDRISLLNRNIKILESIKKEIGEIKKDTIILLVSNPVDLITYAASKVFKLNKKLIFGTGTSLDTSRLRWSIANYLGENPKDINAHVLGEHGDSSFVYWSDFNDSDKIPEDIKENIEKTVKEEAYEIIKGKGSTYFGIACVTAEILESIIKDEDKVFPISAIQSGEFGFNNIAIGVLARLSAKGITILDKKLNDKEQEKFNASCYKLKKVLEDVSYK